MVAMCWDVLRSPSMLNHAAAIRAMGKRVSDIFKNIRYRDGNLYAGAVGQHPLRNPSERQAPLGTFYYLCRNRRKFAVVSKGIADYLEEAGTTISVARIMDVMEDAGFGRYHGQVTHTTVRFARSIVLADRREHADSVDDWRVLRSMSAHVRNRIRRWAIWEYNTAIRFRDGMRDILSQSNYSLLDLVVYTCLMPR